MLRVVVIDNNAISRNLLTSVLTGGGHEVVGDSNASSAGLAGMIKLQPQLVCIDVGEVVEDGLEKIDVLRAGLPKSLIFLVSARLSAPIVERALQQGVQGFIVKPFNAINVLGSIRNCVLKLAKQVRSGQSSDHRLT